MNELDGRRVLLGVTGGIAAYKSPELVRRLRDAGAVVRVVMTAGAQAFVQPLTFQAVSGERVHQDLLDPEAEAAMGHIELARWAEQVLVAPASANFMARLAHGFADDLLTTICLASEAPIALAPAMNRIMWANAATRENHRILVQRGVHLLGPGSGGQACGEMGEGRMMDVPDIVSALTSQAPQGPLSGRQVVVTVGPTREAVDPVRFITNRSSGRMGFAVAAAARRLGARVVAVVGPCNEPTPAGVERIDVETAQQMYETVRARAESCDIFVGAAAVSDYRPADVAEAKIKKNDEQTLSLELVKNPDILQAVAALPGGPFTVGFAAETHDLESHAEDKRRRKGLDMIAANWVGRAEGGFDSAENALHVFWEGGSEELGMQSKPALAQTLMQLVAERFNEKRQSPDTR